MTTSVRQAMVKALAIGKGILRVYAEVFFSRSLLVGGLLFAATITDPPSCAVGILSLCLAVVFVRWMGIDVGIGAAGPYGVNALLLGLGIGHAYQFDLRTLGFALLFTLALVLVTGAVSNALARVNLPALSIPFVLLLALTYGAGRALPLEPRAEDLDFMASLFPAPMGRVLSGAGQLFFAPRVLAGGLVLVALVVHSRIATLFAAVAVGLVVLVIGASPPHLPLSTEALALNAGLTMIAIGAVWFVPSATSLALGASASAVAVALSLGLAFSSARLGVPLGIAPFNTAVLLTLLAMRGRLRNDHPRAVDFAPSTPEANLSYVRSTETRFPTEGLIAFRLPFHGAWTCTQGVDGAHTHKGIWRHGFDFEVRDERGSLCRDSGQATEDYHCYRLPVLAPADGTVVHVMNDVPDNRVGESNLERNWGNYVVVYHAAGVYSIVAHLAPHSVAVTAGQVVRAGELLGRCGSSGRSPRPHLHFQLQTTAALGAPTIPFHFTHVIRRAGAGEFLVPAHTPEDGETLRNPEVDPERAGYVVCLDGDELALVEDGKRETVHAAVDLYGRLLLTAGASGAAIEVRRGAFAYTIHPVEQMGTSALSVLLAALPRLPFDAASELTFCDYASLAETRALREQILWDFVSPFMRGDVLPMRYRVEEKGECLVVTGTSTRVDRKGRSLLSTMAKIGRRSGVESVEVRTPRRTRRLSIERHSAVPDSVVFDCPGSVCADAAQ